MGFEQGTFFLTAADVIEQLRHATAFQRPLSLRTSTGFVLDMWEVSLETERIF